MNYAQVNLVNGTAETVNVFDDDGREIPIKMTKAESDAMATALTELNAADPTNNGWLVAVSGITDPLVCKFVSSSIDNNVANVDKGVDASAFSGAATASQTVLNSVMGRMQTGTTVSLAWLVIRDLDGTNFLAEVSLVDRTNAVSQVEIIFSDYNGPEPIPTELQLPFAPPVFGVKIASVTNLTFDDPSSAVGESYTVLVDFKDAQGNSIESIEFTDVIVQAQ